MAYNYALEKPNLFTEEGTAMLLKLQDNVRRLITLAGAFSASKAWEGLSGDSWQMLAGLDYLVEKKVIVCLSDDSVWGQHRIYTVPPNAR